MSSQTLVLALVVLLGLTSLARGQAVASRAASNDERDSDVGGQTRNIYSHRHLSPHRMMHFGKRPIIQQPPGILASGPVLDLYHRQPQSFPYSLYFPIGSDQVLESVQQPELNSAETTALERNRKMAHVVHQLLELVKQKDCPESEQQQQQQVQQQFGNSARLMNKEGDDSTNNSNNDLQAVYTKKQSIDGEKEQHDLSGSSNGQSDSDEINVASRSVATTRGNALNALPGLSRSKFQWFFEDGRHNANGIPTLGGFIKKAEPQRMTFMHFGR